MRRRDEGIALIAVLWTVTLLSIIAASLSLESRTDIRITYNIAGAAVARAAADAGIQRAILDLLTPEADKIFRADGTTYGWHFAGSDIRISLMDESKKFNLNQTPEVLLVARFESLGIDSDKAQSLADAIADFRDADNLKHLYGAEIAEYRAAGFAWGPKNANFDSVEELQQVLGMTPEIYESVAPSLTTYSSGPFRKVYSISAKAKSPRGAVFVRQAVVRLAGPNGRSILSWRQGP